MSDTTTQPDDRCEQIARECQEIANDLVWTAKGRDSAMVSSIAAALQAKHDEMEALREEVLGVIEPFANIGSTVRASEYGRALRKSEMVEAQLEYYLAAKALRDKIKASQPISPQPQTPHQ